MVMALHRPVVAIESREEALPRAVLAEAGGPQRFEVSDRVEALVRHDEPEPSLLHGFHQVTSR
jgi:hypothetical protein